MKEMNFTECRETRGNTQLLEHKSKEINLPCSPLELSQCQQGLCRKCIQLSLAEECGARALAGRKSCCPALPGEHILQFASPSSTLGPDLHPSLWRLLQGSSFPTPEQQGMGPAAFHTEFLLPSLLPQTRNPLGLQHMLNPLFPPGVLSFFNNFFFIKEDPSAPHPIPTGQEQKLLFLM